jgi:nucleotidyltransferase substrate binding protein (TIGR01987 family)
VAKLSIQEFEKALSKLQEALYSFEQESDQKTKILFRDATIQRFEFTVELGWKVSVKMLGLNTTSPKPAIREMAQAGLIQDVQIWFDAIEARNKSSHSYDEDVAREIIEKIQRYIPYADDLLTILKTK